MLNKIFINLLNKAISTNIQTAIYLQNLEKKTIWLTIPFIELKILVNSNGQLELWEHISHQSENCESPHPSCTITINLGAFSSYLITQDELATFRHLKISGDYKVAEQFLKALSNLNLFNTLYQSDFMPLGITAITLEKLLIKFTHYLQTLFTTGSMAFSQYLQYEKKVIINKLSLEQFYQGVDEVKARTELLAKRIKKLEESDKVT